MAYSPQVYSETGAPNFGLGQSVASTDVPQNIATISLNSGATVYTGYAAPGVLQSEPGWRIKRYNAPTATGTLYSGEVWANGSGNRNLIFNSGVSLAITGITKANPGVVTVSSTAGLPAKCIIYGVGGMTQVNQLEFTITVINATTFSIGVDTTSYSNYTAGGTAYFPEGINYTFTS